MSLLCLLQLPATALRHLSAQNLLEVMQLAVVMPAVGTATSLLEDICASGAADHLAEDAVYDLIAAAIKVCWSAKAHQPNRVHEHLNVTCCSYGTSLVDFVCCHHQQSSGGCAASAGIHPQGAPYCSGRT